MPDVTVIIPCRNQGDTLERAVNSALKCGVHHVIIYNDNSDDNTASIGWQYHQTLASVNYYQSSVRNGVVCARNAMVMCSNQGWVIPLDADDELLCIPDIPQGRWCYGGWIEHDINTGHEEVFTAPPPRMIRQKPLCYATMMFHKDLWKEAGGYDPDFFYGEDFALQCAFSAIEKPTHLDYPLYRRYVGKNERTEQAKKYWPIIQDMARQKWPSVFT